MNRSLVLTVGLLVVLGTTAYGQSFRYNSNSQPPKVLAGEVSPEGAILKGSGFSVQRISTGRYEVRFEQRAFARTCPVITVNVVSFQASPPTAQVFQKQPSCGRPYEVIFSTGADETFDFIAAGTQ
jgi:hypothetical protein